MTSALENGQWNGHLRQSAPGPQCAASSVRGSESRVSPSAALTGGLLRDQRQLRRLDADPAAATFERVAAAAAETGEGPEARMRWRECRGRIGLDRFPGTAQDCLGDLTALALR